jgi:hypothetical protein
VRLSRKALRRTGFALFKLAAVLLLLAAAGCAERIWNAEEDYAVYSAYLSDGLLNDAHDWSGNRPVLVVVRHTTSPGDNLRTNALYVFDSRVGFEQPERSTRASYLVRNLFPTRLGQISTSQVSLKSYLQQNQSITLRGFRRNFRTIKDL